MNVATRLLLAIAVIVAIPTLATGLLLAGWTAAQMRNLAVSRRRMHTELDTILKEGAA